MRSNPVPYKWCSLTQACEWIAFGWKPVSEVYRRLDTVSLDKKLYYDFTFSEAYRNAIYLASLKLMIAIYERKIICLGYKVSNKDQSTEKNAYVVKVDDRSSIEFNYDCIKCPKSEYSYRFVYMKFKSVEKCFPRDENGSPIKEPIEEINQKGKEYNSIYMNIMNNIVNELGITEKNQPSKKSIYFHLLDKYAKKYNLSNNTIQMIASLVLNPESRLGKARK